MVSKLLSTFIATCLLAPSGAPNRPRQPREASQAPRRNSAEDSRIERATRHFKEGQRLFEAGRHLEAAAEFERSEAAISAGETIYNIALSYERGGKHVEALLVAQRYLELPTCGRGVHKVRCASRRAEVERTVERLRERVSELAIEVQDGAEVSGIRIDDRVVPVQEFPILLEPGVREVEVLGTGAEERQVRDLRLVSGETTTLEVAPAAASDEPRAQSEPPPPRPVPAPAKRDDVPEAVLRRGTWAGFGLTLVSGATAGVLGGLTLHYRNVFRSGLCAGECTDPEATHPLVARERFTHFKLATNVMIGVTAAFGIMTLGFGIAYGRARRRSERRVALSADGFTLRF